MLNGNRSGRGRIRAAKLQSKCYGYKMITFKESRRCVIRHCITLDVLTYSSGLLQRSLGLEETFPRERADVPRCLVCYFTTRNGQRVDVQWEHKRIYQGPP